MILLSSVSNDVQSRKEETTQTHTSYYVHIYFLAVALTKYVGDFCIGKKVTDDAVAILRSTLSTVPDKCADQHDLRARDLHVQETIHKGGARAQAQKGKLAD